ncbi:hypothetical protein AB1M95_09435 [Sulfitobacter sp. LCG007]
MLETIIFAAFVVGIVVISTLDRKKRKSGSGIDLTIPERRRDLGTLKKPGHHTDRFSAWQPQLGDIAASGRRH